MAEVSAVDPRPAGILGAVLAVAPGLCASVLIAIAAYAVGQGTHGPSVFFALTFGVALSWIMESPRLGAALADGVEASMKTMLRVGVALLGARITFAELSELGAPVALITLAALALTLGLGIATARAMGLRGDQGLILASATAICGASAALAVAAAIPKSRQTDAAAAIAGVTVVGAICMIAYPIFAQWLGFDERASGVFLGATLHEVAQAVGAGFSVSPTAGEAATAVKLLRVACLAPLVLAVAHYSARDDGSKGAALPWFVVAFAALALLASFNILPQPVVSLAGAASQWLLLVAIAALGLKTSPSRLKAIGFRPLMVLVAQTVFLGLFAAGALLLLS